MVETTSEPRAASGTPQTFLCGHRVAQAVTPILAPLLEERFKQILFFWKKKKVISNEWLWNSTI